MHISIRAGVCVKAVLAGGIACLSGGFSQAADRPVYKAPMVAAASASIWAGCYLGGNVGWIGSDTAIRNYPGGTLLFLAGIQQWAEHPRARSSGVTAGVQTGCNRQSGRWIGGFEADFNSGGARRRLDIVHPDNVPPGVTGYRQTIHYKLDWFSTARWRVGHAWDRLMAFGTAGLAVGHFKTDNAIFFTNGFGDAFAGSAKETRLGLAAGGGLEWMAGPGWSIKAEYLYLHFSSLNYLLTPVPAVAALGYQFSNELRPRHHIARVGINYRFWSE